MRAGEKAENYDVKTTGLSVEIPLIEVTWVASETEDRRAFEPY